MTGRGVRLALAGAALAAAALSAPGAAGAREAGSLLGEWVLQPLDMTAEDGPACRYHQTLDIRKRVAPGRYSGTAHYRYVCKGRPVTGNRVDIVIDAEGGKVRLRSPDPYWIDEKLERVRPGRMEGHDVRDHYRMIYERPKGKPIS